MAKNKRRIANEIAELRSRMPTLEKRFSFVLDRMNQIDELFNSIDSNSLNDKFSIEIYRYIIISLASCIQYYFRLLIMELIDSNDNCRENIRKWDKLPSINLNTLIDVKTDEMSLGEFVSYMLSYSSFKSIKNSMDDILGIDFEKELKREVKAGKYIFVLEKKTIRDIIDLFSLRNIYCHEIPNKSYENPSLDFRTIDYFHSTLDLISNSEIHIRLLLKNIL